jgi:YfiH family protein
MSELKSALLSTVPGISHGFGDILNPVPPSFEPLWKQRATKTQVHGIAFFEASMNERECGKVDTVYTREKLLPVTVYTADCVPILMARRDGGIVSGTHSGWRGTLAGAMKVFWNHLRAQGELPGDWVAAIGPAIGPCCYEVSSQLADEFKSSFLHLGNGIAVPDERRLDLPRIIELELKELGLFEVDRIQACTLCSRQPNDPQKPLYHSYRREKGGTRQFSAILRSSPTPTHHTEPPQTSSF